MKALAVVPLLFTLALTAQDYAIDFGRLAATERVRHVATKAVEENRMTTLVEGKPIRTDSGTSSIALEADLEVLGKDPANRPRLKLRVAHATCMADGNPLDLLPDGLTVLAEYRKDKTVFSRADGTAFPEDVQKLLGMAITIEEDPADDDHAFGTRERKKVGESWPINREWAASKLRQLGCLVDPGNISGSAQLNALVVDQGLECMKILVTMDLREVRGLPLPPGFTLTKAIINCTMAGLFPLDVTKDRLQSSEAFNAEFLGHGKVPTPKGPQEMSIMARMTQTKEAHWTAPAAGKP